MSHQKCCGVERVSCEQKWMDWNKRWRDATACVHMGVNNSCWTVITDVIIEQLSKPTQNIVMIGSCRWNATNAQVLYSTLEFFFSSFRSLSIFVPLFNQLFIGLEFWSVCSMCPFDVRSNGGVYVYVAFGELHGNQALKSTLLSV